MTMPNALPVTIGDLVPETRRQEALAGKAPNGCTPLPR